MSDEWGVRHRSRPAIWRVSLARFVCSALGVDALDVNERPLLAFGGRLLRWDPELDVWSEVTQLPALKRRADALFSRPTQPHNGEQGS
jgi:hypothetical protein